MAKKTFPNYQQRMSPAKIKTRMMTEAEINRIKEEATKQAVEILEQKYNPDDIRTVGYNEAIGDAQKYFILCGCKVLHDVFGFGKKRLFQFVRQVAELEVDTEDGTTTLEALEKWLDDYAGMKLSESSVDDELKKRQENKDGRN